MYRVVELRKYGCDACGKLIQSKSKNIEKDEDRFDISDKDFDINIFHLETEIGVRQDDECLLENIDLCPLCAYKLLDSLGNIGEGEKLKKFCKLFRVRFRRSRPPRRCRWRR